MSLLFKLQNIGFALSVGTLSVLAVNVEPAKATPNCDIHVVKLTNILDTMAQKARTLRPLQFMSYYSDYQTATQSLEHKVDLKVCKSQGGTISRGTQEEFNQSYIILKGVLQTYQPFVWEQVKFAF